MTAVSRTTDSAGSEPVSPQSVSPQPMPQQPAPRGPAAEAPSNVVPIAAEPGTAPPRRRRWRRLTAMLLVPVAIAVGGGWWWMTGGRFMSTENAYVQQHMVVLSTDVSGRIVEVDARENQLVAQGDVIFKLDPAPYQIALEQAEAALASARLQVEQMRATYQGALADLASAEKSVDFYKAEFDRQQTLARNGYAAKAKLDLAQHDLDDASQAVAADRQTVASALAALGGNADVETDRHPLVMKAAAERDQAALDLQHTTVLAPTAGRISQTDRLNVGQYVAAASPVATLVESGEVWVEANFKETELTHMAEGQTVTLTVDAYPDHEFTGTVDGIGAGTGSEFALLPAQNATGNWVKVVQRVPVRIRVDGAGQAALRTGMSAHVSVDTHYQRPLPGFVRAALDWTGLAAVAAPRT